MVDKEDPNLGGDAKSIHRARDTKVEIFFFL